MPKLISEEAEQLLRVLMDTKDVKKYLDDKFISYGYASDEAQHLKVLVDELSDNHLVMCVWYAETIHEAKIPISAEKYFEEKEKALQEEAARKKEEERLQEEARLIEEMRREKARQEEERLKEEARLIEEMRQEKARQAEEEKQREESKKRETTRQKEIEKLQEQVKKADEARQREIMKLQEEARLADEARQREISKLEEQIRIAEEERRVESERLMAEARQREEARIKEAKELLKEAGIGDAQQNNNIFSIQGNISINDIKGQIAKSGGSEAQQLNALLSEAVEIIEEIQQTRRIPKRSRFVNELRSVSGNHMWFYQSVMAIVCKAGVDLLEG